MKRMLAISFITSGAVFSIFLLNLMLYSFMPGYRQALISSVSEKDTDIPVIEATNEVSEESDTVLIKAKNVEINDEKVALSAVIEEEKASEKIDENKPQIIERTYHEDCGTGKGYWVIKYSDGSYGIE